MWHIVYFIWVCNLYSEVFKAKHKTTKRVVALKKVVMDNEKEGVGTILIF